MPCKRYSKEANTPRITDPAMPAGVSAAGVSEAGDVPDEDLVRAQRMSVGASAGWLGYPPTVGCFD